MKSSVAVKTSHQRLTAHGKSSQSGAGRGSEVGGVGGLTLPFWVWKHVPRFSEMAGHYGNRLVLSFVRGTRKKTRNKTSQEQCGIQPQVQCATSKVNLAKSEGGPHWRDKEKNKDRAFLGSEYCVIVLALWSAVVKKQQQKNESVLKKGKE